MLAGNDDSLDEPYAYAALDWLDAGWSPLPLPRGQKAPVPKGYTGYDGKNATLAVVKSWRASHPEGNIAIRCPDGLVGLDIDVYGEKHGDVTLARLEKQYGALPKTIVTSARGFGGSGIRWYRVPAGSTFPGVLGEGIEVIQFHHRYAVAWPSVHPKTGTIYKSYDMEDGSEFGVFAPSDCAELPTEWLAMQAERGVGLDKSKELAPDEVAEWFRDEANAASYCRAMRNTLNLELARLEEAADSGESRYDTARDGVMALVRLAQEGHRGCKRSLAKLRALYEDVVADEADRDPGEWRRMVFGAVAAVSESMEDAHPAGKCPDRAPAGGDVDDTLWPSPNEPFDVAERLVREHWSEAKADSVRPTLRYWRGDFYQWTGPKWVSIDDDHLRAMLYKNLASVGFMSAAQQPTELRWNPNKTKIGNVLEALRAVTHYGGEDGDDGFIAFANGCLALGADGSRTMIEHSPERFNLSSLPFDYLPDAADPKEFFAFLDSLQLDEDEEALLQEWFGCVVSGELSKHKMMLLLGPPRAGKGIITRVLQRLVGRDNYVSPTIDQFGTDFGLQPAIGKSLITINDARFGGRSSKPIIERLLNITGGDDVTVNRKNRTAWQGVLPGRVMIVSNEPPNLTGESSSALVNRFLGPIELRQSFIDREDEGLEHRIAAELPGVLLWALDGMDRLASVGHFTVPERSRASRRELAEAFSPIVGFLADMCEVGDVGAADADPSYRTDVDVLYRAYQKWVDSNGRTFALDKARFGRELRVATNSRVNIAQRRVGEKRVPYYRGIRLVPGANETVVGLDF